MRAFVYKRVKDGQVIALYFDEQGVIQRLPIRSEEYETLAIQSTDIVELEFVNPASSLCEIMSICGMTFNTHGVPAPAEEALNACAALEPDKLKLILTEAAPPP